MGRYGRHNDINYSNPNNYKDPNYRNSNGSNFKVTKDFDSSKEVVEDIEEKPSIVSRIGGSIKERYQKYNSEDARRERESRKMMKRTRTINDLSYNAKKEGLKAQIRKAKQTAPTDFGFGFGVGTANKKGSRRSMSNGAEGVVHFPKNNYGSMDRMLGLGGSTKPKRTMKKPASSWDSFDRMFGI